MRKIKRMEKRNLTIPMALMLLRSHSLLERSKIKKKSVMKRDSFNLKKTKKREKKDKSKSNKESKDKKDWQFKEILRESTQ